MSEALLSDAPAPEAHVAESVPPPAPKVREAWKTRKRRASAKGKGRGNGPMIPPPADEKTMKAVITQLESEAIKAIATGTKVDDRAKELYENMTGTVRAHIMSLLGPDIEEARRFYADELMANSRAVAQHMMQNFTTFPPSVQAFICAMFADKSEMLRAKTASSAHGAKVQIQINAFSDGSIDRNALIRTLTGEAFQAAGVSPEPKPEPVPVVATPTP